MKLQQKLYSPPHNMVVKWQGRQGAESSETRRDNDSFFLQWVQCFFQGFCGRGRDKESASCWLKFILFNSPHIAVASSIGDRKN